MLGEKELKTMESFFRTWELSLYKIPNERIEHLHPQEFEDDMYIDEANHTAAVLLLRRENMQSAERFIEYAVSKDETSIHAWCNKGLYHLMEFPPRITEAQEAKSRMETLSQQQGPLKTARVEYAFWLFNKDRSDEAKERAKEIMEADLGDRREQNNLSHHYLYVKVLVGITKKFSSANKLEDDLKKLIVQLTILAASHDPKYEIQMWVFLADVQNNVQCHKYLAQETTDFSEFSWVTGCDSIDLETCMKQIKGLIDRPNTDLQVKSNFYVRISEALKKVAIHISDENKRKKYLETALEISESVDAVPSCNDRRPLTCANILLALWAIEYLQNHRDEVEGAYRRHYLLQPQSRVKTNELWQFLAIEYYRTALEKSDRSRALLERARKHLNQGVKQKRAVYYSQYSRVLMLLSESPDAIEGVFEFLYQAAESKSDRGCMLRHRGRYFETVERYSNAVQCYKDAKVQFHGLQKTPTQHYNDNQLKIGLERLQT